MIMIDAVSEALRPARSAYEPSTMAPSGRITMKYRKCRRSAAMRWSHPGPERTACRSPRQSSRRSTGRRTPMRSRCWQRRFLSMDFCALPWLTRRAAARRRAMAIQFGGHAMTPVLSQCDAYFMPWRACPRRLFYGSKAASYLVNRPGMVRDARYCEFFPNRLEGISRTLWEYSDRVFLLIAVSAQLCAFCCRPGAGRPGRAISGAVDGVRGDAIPDRIHQRVVVAAHTVE